jgi:hypothetical protein
VCCAALRQLEVEGLTEPRRRALERWGLGLDHALRRGPLPRKLLGALRVLAASEDEVASALGGTDPQQARVDAEEWVPSEDARLGGAGQTALVWKTH